MACTASTYQTNQGEDQLEAQTCPSLVAGQSCSTLRWMLGQMKSNEGHLFLGLPVISCRAHAGDVIESGCADYM